jgi:hypothetical protein
MSRADCPAIKVFSFIEGAINVHAIGIECMSGHKLHTGTGSVLQNNARTVGVDDESMEQTHASR